MANAFLKPEVILATALEMLRREIILPRLVTRYGLADFRGAKDDTVNVRVPAFLTAREYEWRTRSAEIVLDELEELSIPVTLDKHIYSAVPTTDEELTLDITDFAVQVLQPQVIAVAEKLESILGTIMEGATFATADVEYAQGSSDAAFYDALVDARKILNDAHVPQANRIVVIGSGVEASALKEADLRKADASGSTDALRRASLGSLAGFDNIVVSNGVDEDFAVAFHRSAFAFANVAPANPAGAVRSAARDQDGIAMRWLQDYDARYMRDRSVVSSFAGGASVEDGRDPDSPGGQAGPLNGTNRRAVKINFTASS